MKISSLLFEYLVEKDHLGIAGFGEFTAEQGESYIHPVDHGFTPADKKIKFRLDKNTPDDGFIAFLTKKTGGNDIESKNLLKAEVNSWVKTLKAGEEVVLEALGVIQVNASKAVVFVEEERVSLNKKYFGLQDFKMEPLEKPKAAPVAAAAAAVKPEKQTKKRGVLIWISAAAILLILGGGFWFFKDRILTSDIAEIEPVGVDSTIAESEIIPQEDSATESEIVDDFADTVVVVEEPQDTLKEVDPVETPEEAEKETVAISQPQTTGTHYFVIAGCFRSSVKADNYLADLKQKGYDASIEGRTAGGLIRVCYGSYPSWREASKAAGVISEKEGTSAWVQKITN